MKPKIILIAAALLFSGCLGALQSKPAEVAALSGSHGVIVGSVILKIKDESPLFPISLKEKKWHAAVGLVDEPFFSTPKFLDIKPDGKEVAFVSVLPAGSYQIGVGTRGTDPNYSVSPSLKFSVGEKKRTYIGRLVITIPSHAGIFDVFLLKGRPVSVDVEDAQDDAVAILSAEYGSGLAEGLQKGLMSKRQ